MKHRGYGWVERERGGAGDGKFRVLEMSIWEMRGEGIGVVSG